MKNMHKFSYYLLPVLLFFLVNCNSSTEGDEASDNDTAKVVNSSKAATVLYSLPAPVDIASVLMDHPGSKFNQDFLNPADKAAKYNTSKSLALNLGVYGADLSYASFFEQNQVTLNYMVVTKKMAESLGILNSIDEKQFKKIGSNNIDKAGMQKIISESFMNTDSYLQQNNRTEVMTMILIGGWVEAQYLATSLSKGSLKENPELIQRIMEQSLTLELMFSLFDDYKDSQNINEIKADLSKVQKSYEKLNTELNQANYKEFCSIIKEIRTSYTI